MILAARNLSFGYADRPIGQGIDLTVAAGEVLCLLGPNGSGKTTLFKTLLGLLKPQAGSVRLAERDIQTFSRRELARMLAYVPQAGGGYFPYTVLETVLMGRTARIGPFAMPSRHDRAAAEAALAALRIETLRDQVYTRLSGGQRQLVLIARALAQEPRFLIMDEPAASLDFGNQVLVLSRIRMLAERGIGIVLSTHDPDHAFTCADRVALLHGGRLLACGPAQAVVTAANLRHLYGAEVAVVTVPDSGRQVCVPVLQ